MHKQKGCHDRSVMILINLDQVVPQDNADADGVSVGVGLVGSIWATSFRQAPPKIKFLAGKIASPTVGI